MIVVGDQVDGHTKVTEHKKKYTLQYVQQCHKKIVVGYQVDGHTKVTEHNKTRNLIHATVPQE